MKVMGIVGWKNSGKTGLMERLVSEITARGYSVSTVKHAHHAFDVDQPGKDSYRHRLAGAGEVLLSSRKRWALMHENRGVDEPDLDTLLTKLEPVDIVLVEGYKRGTHAKVEAHRVETGKALISLDDTTIVAVASNVSPDGVSVPLLDLNDAVSVADFVLGQVGLGDDPDGMQTGLKDDCFALPAGVDWVPVDAALDALRARMATVVGREFAPADTAIDRILATDAQALRSNPPAANSAVDGFGFDHVNIGSGAQTLPLIAGRAAAGAPLEGAVAPGSAVKILTGALLPDGVDTVILQEDVAESDAHIAFDGPVKAGANTRSGGEDVQAGALILPVGCRLGPAEIALLAATGISQVAVFNRLRVGVLSTGDEIVAAGSDMSPAKTFDANRPMLLGLVEKWGYAPVDLGQVGDDRGALRARLDSAVKDVDVILTSGGASAGEEDHLSALLREVGALNTWRIAVKPGRPLALGQWDGVPIFGLPGNPVAALVCTLIFARPAMAVLAGGVWSAPQGFMVPAGFAKRKKSGRREFLRARMTRGGAAEAFASEGSGRISGLSWAGGLVELGDDALQVNLGDPVRYIPYSSFGI